MFTVVDCYLGDQRENAAIDPLISPYFVSDEILSKFPPTVICVGDVDPIIDDSTAFFNRLQVFYVFFSFLLYFFNNSISML